LKRAERQPTPPLVVLRSETETGHVGLRLVGDLDLSTVAVLEAALARTRHEPPPSVIDLSELRFLDLIGLRALLHAAGEDAAGLTRLVGATGIVRRLIDVARTIDVPHGVTTDSEAPAAPSTTSAAQWIAPRVAHARRPPTVCSAPTGDEERA
jgi:anti-anti-sigma factor